MDSENSSNPFLGSHLPITLLALALGLYFVAQYNDAGVEAEALANQKTALEKLSVALGKQQEKNAKELDGRKALVDTSEKIQSDYAKETQTVKDRTTSAAQFEQLHKQIADLKKNLDDRAAQATNAENAYKVMEEFLKGINALAKANDPDAQLTLRIAKLNKIDVNPEPPKEDDKTDEKKPDASKKPDDKKPPTNP
jgi:hypothetical protein